MKNTSLIKAAVLSSLWMACGARAQNDGAASRFQTNDPPSLNRISAAYRMGFQMNTKFKRLGGLGAKSNPGPATGTAQVHNYDDGYVLPDSRMVDDHFTWNWGFNNPSQVQPGAGTPNGFLLLHSSSSPATATSQQDGDPQHGFEITYNRQLGMIRNIRWGLESAFNFSDVTVYDNRTLKHVEQRTTDTYSLDGLNPYAPPPAPPNTPYMGTPGGGYPGGGGPLISDIPVRRVTEDVPRGATITGNRSFEASAYGLRLGPYFEVPIRDRVSFSFSGGLALVVVDSEFHFKETVTVPGLGSETRSGTGSHSDLMAGWYVSGSISYALSDSIGLFAGVQYQDVGLYKETEKRKQAQLQLGGNVFLSLGLSFSF